MGYLFYGFWAWWAVVFGMIALASGGGVPDLLVAVVAGGAVAVWHDSFKDVEVYFTAVIVIAGMGAWMANVF